MQDRIIVLYTWDLESIADKSTMRTLYAASLNLKNGAIIESKEIFKNSSRRTLDIKVNVSPDEQVCHLLVRYTTYKGNGQNWYKKMAVSSGLELYSLKKDLQMSAAQAVSSKAINGFFLAAGQLPDGNLFLVSYNENQLTVEKVNTNGSIIDQITTTTNFGDAYFIIPRMHIDTSHVYLSLTYSRKKEGKVMNLYDIDWQAKAIKQKETIFNKQHGESLHQKYGEAAAHLKKALDQLQTMEVIVSADKVIVINQTEHMRTSVNSHTTTFSYNDLLISVYNKQLERTGDIIVGKSYTSFMLSGVSVGFRITGNKMHLLYNRNAGMGKLAGAYALLDLDKYSIEKQETITQNICVTTPTLKAMRSYGSIIPPWYLIIYPKE